MGRQYGHACRKALRTNGLRAEISHSTKPPQFFQFSNDENLAVIHAVFAPAHWQFLLNDDSSPA
jgi:hypothetical protein